MQHISGYNDLMNKSFITDLASTWNGHICVRAEDLWLYQWLYPCGGSTIPSSPGHLPHCCLLKLESPLAIPASSHLPSDPSPVGCSPAQQQPRGRFWQHGFSVLCQDSSCTLSSPALSPLLPADPCIPLVFTVKDLERWTCSKTKLFFFKNNVTGIEFGFFSDLFYLWVELWLSASVITMLQTFVQVVALTAWSFSHPHTSLLNVWELGPISLTEPMPEGRPDLIATDGVPALSCR